MDIALLIVAFILAIVGIVGSILPVIPGLIFSYSALVAIYFTSYSEISLLWMVVWLMACIFVSAADYFLPAVMARHFGGSRPAMVGATVGAIAGIFIYPPIGLLVMPFFGAMAGELIHDHKDIKRALKVGWGSFLSFIVGTGIKLIVAVGIAMHIAADGLSALVDWITNIF